MNGNLARGLLARPSRMSEVETALAWCSHLVGEQAVTRTHDNASTAGFWGVGYPVVGPSGSIYFGDTGTAVTVLAKCYRNVSLSRPAASARMLEAMERYARYVQRGCSVPPPGGQGAESPGWILPTGAVGCGYYKGHLSRPPYTIATATTGAAFFAELALITDSASSRKSYAAIAAAALAWIATTVRADGVIPYILDNETASYTQWPLDTISYVTEGIVGVDVVSRMLGQDVLVDGEIGATEGWTAARDLLRAATGSAVDAFRPTVEWLLANQNQDGSWGVPQRSDTLRSPRVVSLLQWYYLNTDANQTMDTQLQNAASRFVGYLTRNDNWLKQDPALYPGFVAISLADLLVCAKCTRLVWPCSPFCRRRPSVGATVPTPISVPLCTSCAHPPLSHGTLRYGASF